MAFTNFDTKEINCKVIYFGPPASGKTANLKSIFASTSSEVRTGLLEVAPDDGSSSRLFDFLPVSLGHIKDFHLKLHLFTIPTNSLYQSVPSVILKGVDGFVFVADSRIEAIADNIDCFAGVRRLLTETGYNIADLPRVFQYNKRDLPELAPVEILRNELNPGRMPEQEAVAVKSLGTMETLQAMAKQVVKRLAQS